jgi:hypothetical protein
MCQYRIKTNPCCWQPHYIYTIPVESHESIVPPTATRLMQPAQSETRSEKIAPGGRAINHQRQTPAANSPIPMHARHCHCNTLRLACVAACADNLPRDASPASPGIQQLKSTATFCAVLHSTESLDASKLSPSCKLSPQPQPHVAAASKTLASFHHRARDTAMEATPKTPHGDFLAQDSPCQSVTLGFSCSAQIV